jgi:hypothetical protein
MDPKTISREYNRQKKAYYSAKLSPMDEMEYLKKYAKKLLDAPTRINKRTYERQLRNTLEKVGLDMDMLKEIKKISNSVANVNVPEKETVTMPETKKEIVEVKTTESKKMKRADLGRLRKKLLADIERLRITVGLPSRSIDRMKRNAETGRVPTVLKLAQELQKYEVKYDEEMTKVEKSRAKRELQKMKNKGDC